MRKKDSARIALLGILARRGIQLSPHVTISAPVEMLAKMLPSLIQSMLQIKAVNIVNAHLCLVGSTLTMEVKVSPYGSAIKESWAKDAKNLGGIEF